MGSCAHKQVDASAPAASVEPRRFVTGCGAVWQYSAMLRGTNIGKSDHLVQELDRFSRIQTTFPQLSLVRCGNLAIWANVFISVGTP